MLIVGGGIWNDRVVITSFNYRHRAGEVDDIYYTIAMKRYRAPVVTTSPNPDALWDRRSSKDPRSPGAGIPTEPTPDPADAQPLEIPVNTDPPPPADVWQGPVLPGRASIVTIESDGLVLGNPASDIRGGGQPHGVISETFTEVVARFSKVGPNTMSVMLNSPWVIDDGYNPYTSMLQIGHQVKYYKEQPDTAGKPTVLAPSTGAEAVAQAIARGAVGVSEEIARAWEVANNAVRPPDWFTKQIGDWDLNYRPPNTVAPPQVPTNTPQNRPGYGRR